MHAFCCDVNVWHFVVNVLMSLCIATVTVTPVDWIPGMVDSPVAQRRFCVVDRISLCGSLLPGV